MAFGDELSESMVLQPSPLPSHRNARTVRRDIESFGLGFKQVAMRNPSHSSWGGLRVSSVCTQRPVAVHGLKPRLCEGSNVQRQYYISKHFFPPAATQKWLWATNHWLAQRQQLPYWTCPDRIVQCGAGLENLVYMAQLMRCSSSRQTERSY